MLALGACTLAPEPLPIPEPAPPPIPAPEPPPIPEPAPEPIHPPQLTYTLKVVIMPIEAGSVTSDPYFSTYSSGTNVTLTAIPSAGYLFSSWSGDTSSTESTITITMDSNKNIITNFVEAYTLQAAARPANAGDVVLSPGGGTYPSDTRVTLTVSLAANYRFASWSGDIGGTNPVMIIIMDSNKSVTAHLVPEGW